MGLSCCDGTVEENTDCGKGHICFLFCLQMDRGRFKLSFRSLNWTLVTFKLQSTIQLIPVLITTTVSTFFLDGKGFSASAHIRKQFRQRTQVLPGASLLRSVATWAVPGRYLNSAYNPRHLNRQKLQLNHLDSIMVVCFPTFVQKFNSYNTCPGHGRSEFSVGLHSKEI